MAIDYSTIKDLLSYIRSTVSDLESLEITEEVLIENKERAAAAKYFLQTAVEACANIAEHIIFGLDLGNPTTSKELFPILVQHHIIDKNLAEKLKDAVGMRNILVHLYLEVNLAIVANSATVGLDDLRQFAKQINEFLEKQKDPETSSG